MSTILEVKDLKKYFKVPNGSLHAVDGVSFQIEQGKTLGVVGESGCGKSTLGRVILHLIDNTSGQILYNGEDITRVSRSQLSQLRKEMQIIFQDPFSSLNPRMTVYQTIAEPMQIAGGYSKTQIQQRVEEMMDTVGLAARFVNAYPHELDGGRRQRIGIARALVLNPKFIVCDEPVSALDVSIQAQLHPYTKALISAVPIPDIDHKQERILLKGELSSPINPKPGCRFAARCPYAKEVCAKEEPEVREIQPSHFVRCHFVEEIMQ